MNGEGYGGQCCTPDALSICNYSLSQGSVKSLVRKSPA